MLLSLLFQESLSAIMSNKLRSVLSILGIVIGISSVVIMLAIGEGAKQSILSSFDNIDNLMSIEEKYDFGPPPDPSKKDQAQTSQSTAKDVITAEIAQTLPQKVYGIDSVIFIAPVNIYDIKYNTKPVNGSIKGISNLYLQTKNYTLKDGTYFSQADFENNERTIILGYSLIADAFGKENPLGKKVFIAGSSFIVKGVLAKNNWQTDYTIYMPSTTALNRMGAKKLEKIEVFTQKNLDIQEIKRNLSFYLLKKSGVEDPSMVKFSIKTNDDALKQVNEIVGKMSMLLLAIGSIALVVGGIGIMNIMLVSVTERTREIGIRKAIGAMRAHILLQFLLEAVVLSVVGFLVASALCFAIAYGIEKFLPDFKPIITTKILVIASIVSISIGILFGLMPAWKASRLRPIDALRFE